MRRSILSILLYWLLSGVFFVAGALIGGLAFHRPGLIVGAALGGIVGAPLITWLAARLHLVTFRLLTVAGAEVGILLAFTLAGTHLDNWMICLASPLLVGLVATGAARLKA